MNEKSPRPQRRDPEIEKKSGRNDSGRADLDSTPRIDNIIDQPHSNFSDTDDHGKLRNADKSAPLAAPVPKPRSPGRYD